MFYAGESAVYFFNTTLAVTHFWLSYFSFLVEIELADPKNKSFAKHKFRCAIIENFELALFSNVD